jgi:hypothetical protein
MKYLRWILYVSSVIPVSFVIALTVYYKYNRSKNNDNLPDSVMYHDTSTIYYKIADNLFFSWILSIIPALIILIVLKTGSRRNDMKNKRVTSLFIVCTFLSIVYMLTIYRNPIVYFFG